MQMDDAFYMLEKNAWQHLILVILELLGFNVVKKYFNLL
jgi:hypothetical protein